MDNQDKIAHLGFIQSVINRMGNNSFLVKSWSVTLLAALFATLSNDNNLYILFLPLIIFWILDAYFLHQERLYRKLYEKVALGLETSEQFSMNACKYQSEVATLKCIVFSKTLFGFYGTLSLITLLLICVN